MTGTNTQQISPQKNLTISQNTSKIFRSDFLIPNLKAGKYFISPAVAEGEQSNHVQHHWVHDAIIFEITATTLENQSSWLISLDSISFAEDVEDVT